LTVFFVIAMKANVGGEFTVEMGLKKIDLK